jgi:hypothetical protein
VRKGKAPAAQLMERSSSTTSSSMPSNARFRPRRGTVFAEGASSAGPSKPRARRGAKN